MAGLLSSIPVILSGLIAAFLPPDVLPHDLKEAFIKGGWGMQLILFAFLVSLWLLVDRSVVILRSGMDAHAFMQRLSTYLGSGDVAGAQQFCNASSKPLPRIVAAGLAVADHGPRRVLSAMDEVAYREVPAIEKRTGFLALMGNVATLMGLFGTIVGLIHSFGAVSDPSAATDNATALAAGISEAMNCTAFGLLTGILALAAFSLLNGRTQAIVDDINLFSLRAFRTWKRGAGIAAEIPQTPEPIGSPHPHLMETIGLLKAKGHGRAKKDTFASLQLTPLIDMFIVLVIFLLLSFSASGHIISANQNIRLPLASKVEDLFRVPVVSISNMPDHPDKGIVALEGREVATVQELIDDTGPDWKINKLSSQLEDKKNTWNARHRDEAFKGELIIQCDSGIGFRVLKKVIYSAGVAGYGNLLFAVQKQTKEEG